MKRNWMKYLAIITIGSAIISQLLMAQAISDVDAPPVNVSEVMPSSILPAAAPIVAYHPPTEREKLRLFAFDAFGPYAFAKAILAGGRQQITNTQPSWGHGWNSFGTRVASNYGIQLTTTAASYGLAQVFHEDAVYYRCACGSILHRFRHAMISTLTARRGADGHEVFSFSRLISPYVGTMTALAWYPDRFGVKDGFRMGNYNLLGQAFGNLAVEFIYGGPHTLLKHFRRTKDPDGYASVQDPDRVH